MAFDRMAAAAGVAAAIGAVGWEFLGGLAALAAGTVSLVLGILALRRIRDTARRGRWAAAVGIAFGAVVYAVVLVTIARDLIDPVYT